MEANFDKLKLFAEPFTVESLIQLCDKILETAAVESTFVETFKSDKT